MSKREVYERQLIYSSIRIVFKDTNGDEISVGLFGTVRGMRMGDGNRPIGCRWDGRPPIPDVNFDRRDIEYLREWLYTEVSPCLHGDPVYKAEESFERMVRKVDGLND